MPASLVGLAGLAGQASGGGSAPTETLPPLVHPHVEYSALLPVLITIGGALVILTLSALIRRRPRPGLYSVLTIITGVAAGIAAIWQWNHFNLPEGARRAVVDPVAVDGFSIFVAIAIASAIVIGALVADSYLPREGLDGPEFYVLALLSASGGMPMAQSNDLLLLFLGLEILSISLYVMAGFHRRRAESGEAAMKYFILGAF